MIRLALLIPTLDRSGAEKQLTLLATRLPRDEFEVHVFALTRGGPYANVLRERNVPLTVLDKSHKLDLGAYRRLKAALQTYAPDVLHTWLFAANSYGRLAVGGRARPAVVVSERCVDTWKSGWQLWLDRRLVARTDRLVGNSQSVVEFYQRQGVPAAQTSVIYNCIESPDTSASDSSRQKKRLALLRELDLPEDVRLVGFVGRLAKQKRVSDLLWAIQVLRQANENVRLLLVGDGPERSALEQYARDVECHEFVRFLGHRADAAELTSLLDVFWLASDFEGLSNSLMEAMAAGIPVVATDIPPNRELVEHDVQGYLADVGDAVAFAQYAGKLLDDEALAQRLGWAGRSRMAEEFSVQKMVDAHVALYRQLVDSQPSTLNPQRS